MTDEKIPYIQCLYHTGKKVYKYWLAGLAVIGVIIGLYFIIVSQWKQICNLLTATENFFDFRFNIIWSFVCTVPWYWWVAIGVIAGPFILVAIWCALKHFDVKENDVLACVVIVITIVTVWGVFNLLVNIMKLNMFDFFFGLFSCVWLGIWVIILTGTGDTSC